MKKRLPLLLVLTGVMIVVSSSVFASELPNTRLENTLFNFEGYNSDNNLKYHYSINYNINQILIDLMIENNTDESVVLDDPELTLIFHEEEYYGSGGAYVPTSFVVTGGAFLTEKYHASGIVGSTTFNDYYRLKLLLEDSVFDVGEYQNYQIVITLNGATEFRNHNVLSTISFPDVTLESDPIYEATVVSNEIAVKEETIHQAETQWYQNNETAIQAVGLENFNFSSGTTGGLQVMQQQFSNIWNALGDLNLIYVFTLLMSLATFILRHWPRTRASETITDTVTHTTNLNTGEESAFLTTRKTFRR